MAIIGTILIMLLIGSVSAYYSPCNNCYVTTPTIAPVYETVGISFDVSPAYVKSGQSTRLSGYQTSGTTLSPLTSWQFMSQSGSDIQVLNGQSVTFKPKKSAATYSISLTARDTAQMLNGYVRYVGVVRTR
jgi:type 1 fimbria pilin